MWRSTRWCRRLSPSAQSQCAYGALTCLRSAYAVSVGARRSTSRIIFITDLNSDQCNADDPDDAEFLQQVCFLLVFS